MRVIPREVRRITYSTKIREFKKNLFLTPIQRDVLVGTLLGDGSLLSGFWKNYRLSIIHSIVQEKYVNWKYKVFRNWVLRKPRFYHPNNSLSFRTVSHLELTKYRELFYRDKTKIVPENIEELLSPLVLAVWYMDDGNIRRQNGKVYGYYLNTQSFTYKENLKLSEILKRKFNLESYVLRSKRRHRLYFGSKSKNIFPKLIEKYILPSLKYKIR